MNQTQRTLLQILFVYTIDYIVKKYFYQNNSTMYQQGVMKIVAISVQMIEMLSYTGLFVVMMNYNEYKKKVPYSIIFVVFAQLIKWMTKKLQ